MTQSRIARTAVVAILALCVARLVVAYRYHFIDGVNLLIHEAGHLVLAPFGQTLSMLGGTLLPLAFPLAFVVHFARRGQRFEAGVCGVLAAESGIRHLHRRCERARAPAGGRPPARLAQAVPAGGGATGGGGDRRGLHALASLGAIVAAWAAARSVSSGRNTAESPEVIR